MAPGPVLTEHFNIKGKKGKFLRGKGCTNCQGIGYRGRASIGELLVLSDELSEHILHRPTTAQLEQLAIAAGMEPIVEDGLKKAMKGITSLEELIRVLPT